ncbi:NAD(P)-binding domain-containing protein [Nocardioides sp.]|uniref:NAD(P)-binding domain-containing protein n=1 Tax=Nocardioides sp. TaxID=35761 RepID=UPI0031FEDBA1|nr:hypothetical protein [Nocardioides sp.]
MNDGVPAYDGGVIGVIGVGSLAAAIVTGLCAGREHPPQVLLSPRGAATAAALASRFPTVEVAADNQAVADRAALVIVCVRTQDAHAVLGGINLSREHVVVSALAGVSLEELERLAAPATRVARAMPLPSVSSREGLTPVYPPLPAVLDLFERLGGALPVRDGAAFEALVAAAATIAGHLAYLGAIARWLVEQGVSEKEAQRYVTATYGALAGQLRSGADLDELTAEVATPGGLNEQFARQLHEAGVFDAVDRGLAAVLARMRA